MLTKLLAAPVPLGLSPPEMVVSGESAGLRGF